MKVREWRRKNLKRKTQGNYLKFWEKRSSPCQSWHSWSFLLKTRISVPPERDRNYNNGRRLAPSAHVGRACAVIDVNVSVEIQLSFKFISPRAAVKNSSHPVCKHKRALVNLKGVTFPIYVMTRSLHYIIRHESPKLFCQHLPTSGFNHDSYFR